MLLENAIWNKKNFYNSYFYGEIIWGDLFEQNVDFLPLSNSIYVYNKNLLDETYIHIYIIFYVEECV